LLRAGKEVSHRIRNRLNAATLALHLLQKQLEAGLTRSGEATIENALHELESLDRDVGRDLSDAAVSHARRALLVEDNSNESELLAGYLRLCGYEVDTAQDGLAAISYLRERERPDVVLLDMMMPRLDGAKTVTSIRSDPRLEGIRVFAVSGSDRESMGMEIGPRGVDRWFRKPINPRDFVAELDKHLSVHA
jgi:CheY-like chemotaxis protein